MRRPRCGCGGRPGFRGTRWAACLLLALPMLLAAGAPAWGQSFPVGNVLVQQGWVKVRHEGQEHFFSADPRLVQVYEGDVLHTGPDSRAKLTLRGQDEGVQLYSNSHLTVAVVKPKLSSFALNVGKALFSYLRSRQHTNDFKVQTQTAVMGVKGTEFSVSSEKDKTLVATLSGTVSLERVDRPEEAPVEVKAGEMVVTAENQPTPEIRAITPEVRQILLEGDGGIEELESVEKQAYGLEEEEAIPEFEDPFQIYLGLLGSAGVNYYFSSRLGAFLQVSGGTMGSATCGSTEARQVYETASLGMLVRPYGGTDSPYVRLGLGGYDLGVEGSGSSSRVDACANEAGFETVSGAYPVLVAGYQWIYSSGFFIGITLGVDLPPVSVNLGWGF